MVTEKGTRTLHERDLTGLSESKDEAAQKSPGHREAASNRMGGDGRLISGWKHRENTWKIQNCGLRERLELET